MNRSPKTWAVLAFLGAASAWAGADRVKPLTPPATPNQKQAVLKIGGEVGKPLALSAADLAGLPRVSFKAVSEHGGEVQFSGVPLGEIAKLAGVPLGENLSGPRLADFLLVETADGNKVVFALPEIDPAFADRVVLLADQANGKPLSDKDGPFRIVVPGEERQGRWVRRVTAISVLHANKIEP